MPAIERDEFNQWMGRLRDDMRDGFASLQGRADKIEGKVDKLGDRVTTHESYIEGQKEAARAIKRASADAGEGRHLTMFHVSVFVGGAVALAWLLKLVGVIRFVG